MLVLTAHSGCCESPERLSLEPAFAAAIERRYLWPVQARHVGLHLVADPGLQIGEMAVALRKLRQQSFVQFEPCGWIQRIEAVFLVDRLAQHQAPTFFALFQEVIEAAGADHVADDVVDAGTLRDRHLGLRDGARARNVDRRTAEKMQDADAAFVTLLAHLDEFVRSALEPGRHHTSVVMPHGAEAVPHKGIAPHCPVLNQVADGTLVFDFAGIPHACPRSPVIAMAHTDLARRRPRWQVAQLRPPRLEWPAALFPHARASAI